MSGLATCEGKEGKLGGDFAVLICVCFSWIGSSVSSVLKCFPELIWLVGPWAWVQSIAPESASVVAVHRKVGVRFLRQPPLISPCKSS